LVYIAKFLPIPIYRLASPQNSNALFLGDLGLKCRPNLNIPQPAISDKAYSCKFEYQESINAIKARIPAFSAMIRKILQNSIEEKTEKKICA